MEGTRGSHTWASSPKHTTQQFAWRCRICVCRQCPQRTHPSSSPLLHLPHHTVTFNAITPCPRHPIRSPPPPYRQAIPLHARSRPRRPKTRQCHRLHPARSVTCDSYEEAIIKDFETIVESSLPNSLLFATVDNLPEIRSAVCRGDDSVIEFRLDMYAQRCDSVEDPRLCATKEKRLSQLFAQRTGM